MNFCDVECMANYYEESGMFAGKNSGTWLGGSGIYYGDNWLSQRRKVRKRDDYKCQDCGISEKNLNTELSVHHIKKIRDFNGDWKSANQMTNLVSLCASCHRIRHCQDYKNKSVGDIV